MEFRFAIRVRVHEKKDEEDLGRCPKDGDGTATKSVSLSSRRTNESQASVLCGGGEAKSEMKKNLKRLSTLQLRLDWFWKRV